MNLTNPPAVGLINPVNKFTARLTNQSNLILVLW